MWNRWATFDTRRPGVVEQLRRRRCIKKINRAGEAASMKPEERELWAALIRREMQREMQRKQEAHERQE